MAKALSWRVVAFVITFGIAFLITGKTEQAIGIGFIDSLVKIFAYYTHERVWFRVPYGKLKPSEYEI